MVEGVQAAHHVKRSVGEAEVFDGIGDVLHGMKVNAELAVGIDQGVDTDPPTGVAGPFERSSRSTADVKDALSGEERPIHTELLREERFEVLIAEHAFLLGESSSPEVELCSGLVGRAAEEPLTTCSEKSADVHTAKRYKVGRLCARRPFIDPCASCDGLQESGAGTATRIRTERVRCRGERFRLLLVTQNVCAGIWTRLGTTVLDATSRVHDEISA